ncbi:TRAP transporter substrate-binding protein DctP [Roseovarius aestuarii]|nr:TRAP transporter substrate-binding protein DctP [Roseovarius aestuarii]
MNKLKSVCTALAVALSVTSASAGTTINIQATASAGDWVQNFYEEWADKYNAMTGPDGTKIEVMPFQAVVPYRETLDAVANGILGGDMSAISYFTGRDQLFSIMGDLIAGYDTVDQVQTFCQYGGGKEFMQKVYDETMPGKMHVVGCAAFSREALVSTTPINGLEDLKGLKIRSPEGLASEVFKRAGAAPVALPYSEVFTSLEKGVVDAADASSYINNSAAGLYKIAKYPLYPGIHSMATFQLVLSKDAWDSMSEADQVALDVWFTAMFVSLARASDLEDKRIAAEDTAAGDITIINWAQEDRDGFRAIASEAWEAVAAKSELATEALNTHKAFMKTIGLLD